MLAEPRLPTILESSKLDFENRPKIRTGNVASYGTRLPPESRP